MSTKSLALAPNSEDNPLDWPRVARFESQANANPSRVDRIGRYRLDRLIAVGGMGSVHRGILSGAAGFSRVVAIKRLHPELARDPLFKARFVEEARLNALVIHPNVVQLLDVIEFEDELWLIMEHVEGNTLQALQAELWATGQKLPLTMVAGVIAAVLEGLHFAHEATDVAGRHLGIVHRDVSPQNIMVSRLGQVKVIDFGIAKATTRAGGDDLGQLAGKVSYMSPEQASGGLLDQRSDTFAVGIVLWEALTGRRLFREAHQTRAEILRDIARKPVLAPSTFRTGIPKSLDAVVLRALERDRRARFGSAREFVQALVRAVPPASPPELGAYLSAFFESQLARRMPNSARPEPHISPTASQRNPDPNPLDNEVTALALTGQTRQIQPRRERERWRVRGNAAAIFLAIACVSLLFVHWGARAIASKSAVAMAVSADQPAARAQTRLNQAPNVLEPSGCHMSEASAAIDPALVSASASAAVGPSLPARPPPASVLSHVRRRVNPKRVSSLAAVRPTDCSPPTYLGEDGIRHFKERCL